MVLGRLQHPQFQDDPRFDISAVRRYAASFARSAAICRSVYYQLGGLKPNPCESIRQGCGAAPQERESDSRTREDLNRFERSRFRRGTWLALPFATVHIEYPGCTPSGWRRGFVANCARRLRWCGAGTVNSRCWWTERQWLMAAPWQPWACSRRGGKCSMPFGRHSPADRLRIIGQLLPAKGIYSCLTPH